MDEISVALEEAWLALLDRAIDDPEEVMRRLQRRGQGNFRRPLRAWSLCLRASDTRIRHEVTAFFDEGLEAHREPHDVVFPGWGLRKLFEPVEIPWPGVRSTVAGAMLGMTPESLQSWIRHGVLHVDYDHSHAHGYRGKPCPILWADGPLDPNANLGRGPDALWGNLWQSLHQRIPDDMEIALHRVPRSVKRRGRRIHLGWDWQCPGLPDAPPLPPSTAGDFAASDEIGEGARIACRGRARRIYWPVSVWTVGQHFGPEHLPLQIPQPLRDRLAAIARTPLEPGAALLKRPTTIAGLCGELGSTSPFACRHCWNLSFSDLADPKESWRQFVTHISGGLLYGYEVRKPAGLRSQRRRKFRPMLNCRPSRRREQVLNMLLTCDLTIEQIGETLGIRRGTVNGHIMEIYRQHGVHSRNELRRNSGYKPLPVVQLPHTARRRKRVADLLSQGLNCRQIARQLKATYRVVHMDSQFLRGRRSVRRRRQRAVVAGD